MALVRTARNHGGLLDAVYLGRNPMTEVPWPVHEAVKHAATIIGWFELSSEDRPPENLWLSGDHLDDWFRQVEARWKSGSTGKSATEDEHGYDTERGQVETNPLADDILRKLMGNQ